MKRNYIINQLFKIPIIVGLWLTFFALIIFIPMPNNKIVNNSKDYILVSTHAHTEYSHDGLITQNNMWKWQKNNGFDAFFITDHANHKKTYELMSNQRRGDFPIAPLIMTGEEYSASNHMSLLGLRNKFESGDLADQAIVDSVHAYGGVVIINHWFDDQRKTLNYYRDLGIDGFEIENSGSDIYYDRELYHKMIDYCTANNLIMIGGLDFHGYGNACTLWNAMKIPGWHNLKPIEKEAAILKVLKNADQSKNRILMYKDRSYYKNENLIFTPVFTLINYFRTLNIYQVLSWFFWLIIFKLVAVFYKKRQISSEKSMALTGLAGALFIIFLAMFYYLKIDGIIGYTKMYVEYSSLFFYIGFIFMAYMLIYIFFKIIKPKRVQNV